VNPVVHAIRLGLKRGVTLFRQMMTSVDGVANTLFWNGIPLAILFLNRDTEVEGSPLSFSAVALPGFLGIGVTGAAYGVAYYIAAEREDGTLLRAKAVPNGVIGYVTGVLTLEVFETAVTFLFLLVPGILLFEGIGIQSPSGLLLLPLVVLLGLLAILPVGVILGSVVKSPRLIGGLGLLILGALTVVSGILFPLQALPTGLQVLGQALPPYWIGLGLRAVFLPDAHAVLEIGQSWRTLEMFAVLGAWAVVSAVVAPVVLQRMARRATGSSVEASRQEALQRM
jgi:ABC-2 type transport system permease protein